MCSTRTARPTPWFGVKESGMGITHSKHGPRFVQMKHQLGHDADEDQFMVVSLFRETAARAQALMLLHGWGLKDGSNETCPANIPASGRRKACPHSRNRAVSRTRVWEELASQSGCDDRGAPPLLTEMRQLARKHGSTAGQARFASSNRTDRIKTVLRPFGGPIICRFGKLLPIHRWSW